MTIREILNSTEHRPWAIPTGSWKFYQEWNDAIFIHWQVDLNELQKFVPKEIEIDLFDGKAWVSLVAFTMEKIRPKNLPALSLISNFDEINIRTYVKYKGKQGVYFLSVEGGKNLSCKVAKVISELPYRFSKMNRQKGVYKSHNFNYSDKLLIKYNIGESLNEKEDIDLWLTERYALFQNTENSINEFDIHHIEWPIQKIDLNILDLKYERFNNLLSDKPNRVNYSKGVKVLAWGKRKTTTNTL